jgi:hypothetical protein
MQRILFVEYFEDLIYESMELDDLEINKYIFHNQLSVEAEDIKGLPPRLKSLDVQYDYNYS